jgi:polygalacturonase
MRTRALWLAGFVFALLCCFMTAEKVTRTYAHTPSAVLSTSPGGATKQTGVYDVRAFGAKGDGRTLDTPAINRAIATAAAKGGGTVRFPAGTYLSVSIHLKSNIALYIDQGATIVAAETANGVAYDPPEPNQWDAYQDFGHSHWHKQSDLGREPRKHFDPWSGNDLGQGFSTRRRAVAHAGAKRCLGKSAFK